jgi:CelD/BcsL family acetyltransferase involved in cellulose biosynthesis
LTDDYEVRVLEDFPASDSVRKWEAITGAVVHRLGWFQSPQWVLSWWETFGHRATPLVLGVHAGGELVAVAPWCVSEGEVRCMGDPLNDLNFVATRRGHAEDAVLRALLRALWPILEARRLPARTLRLECWPAPLPDPGGRLRVEALPALHSPAVALPADWDGYLASLPRQRRRRLEQAVRRLARALPALRLEVATEPARLLELGRSMLRLREATLGPRGLAAECEPTSRAAPFGRLLARLAARQGPTPRVVVGALVDGSEVVAAGLYFRGSSFLMKYMQGWSLRHLAWSPGTVLDLEMIRYGLASGIRTLELGRGDEPYKTRLGAREHPLHGYTVTRPGEG